ncbi:NitT/TauT family transport system ATP-binding protein/sulfonate transport system ATP-binding protein [Pseudoduganella lurida]|uniref:NitT/TauT family transport system ATP-binding protein/sulfonate transport system ATP-binding protein n=1 Tax=Pseudoduganella lurida TaxID=1036180 RepID=A0A562RMZ1_9BURK|nr:ABC transporter ATP-binding protein [Pseudoduganella lurida]TWI69790.1 NitT/TauT family transport system ATP-binding protein/sulfonate transport system ATP-binding protein [Pseudoduganella lurida]
MSLSIQHLNKTYGSGAQRRQVLKDIDLEIGDGEFVAIVGRSGCGKSTLLRLLAGLDREHEGRLLHDGVPITGTDLRRGVVFQDHRLFPWLTVAGNVMLPLAELPLPAAEKHARVLERLARLGLADHVDAYPKAISGGMAQRVAIARALVNRPPVLLLDEPFSALDAITRGRLQQELLGLWRDEGLTVVIVTHDIEEAVLLAQRVVVLDRSVRRIQSVDLAHPRRRGDPAFGALHDRLLAEFHDDLAPTA